NKLVGLFPLQTMSVGMLALFTNDTQSYSNIALPSDSPYHHRQSELHNELYFSINIRKNQHHTIAEACVNKFGCYLRFVFINNHLDICVFFDIFPEFSKGMRKNDRLFKGNEITLNMLTKTLCVARFWRFTIIGQAPKVNRFIS